jgi:alkylation response protein AidB-like acyl-CoA dehydrogenase
VIPRASAVTAANLRVHGGIGYTWEHPAPLYYKRALTSAHLLGEIAMDWTLSPPQSDSRT